MTKTICTSLSLQSIFLYQLQPHSQPNIEYTIVEKIKAGENADFSELPLAKRKSHTSSQNWDVRTLLLQVQQTESPRCLILDFPAWAQRFALFATVMASHQPSMVRS